MKDNLTEKLTQKILESIPSNIKSTDYLMDILELGRESVYRRLKGDIAFTLKEIIILATNLSFSIDELIAEVKTDQATFGIVKKETHTSLQSFQAITEFYYDLMYELHEANNKYMEISMNQLFIFMVTDKENLFKFLCYRWIHQFEKVPLNYFLSEVKIQDKIKSICKKTQHYTKFIDTVIIIDPNIFLNLITEIRYFYDRKLISDEELRLLRDELKSLLNEMEILVQKGVNEMGTKIDIYISSFYIENNSAYNKHGNCSSMYLGIHSGSVIYSHDRQVCSIHKDWLNSLKKYSTLISNCNEKMQADFFNQQYKYLEEL